MRGSSFARPLRARSIDASVEKKGRLSRSSQNSSARINRETVGSLNTRITSRRVSASRFGASRLRKRSVVLTFSSSTPET
jgi:hypothetical protein